MVTPGARVGYGVCVGSWDRFSQYVMPNIDRLGGRPLIALYGQTSIAEAYNTILNAYQGKGFDLIVLQHDDLEITDPDAEAKLLAAAAAGPDVAIVGVCGGGDGSTLAWWNGSTVGHQQINGRMLDFGPRTGDVAIAEGSIMAFTPLAVESLRFDTRYPGFHSYDEVCMAATRILGGRVVVADVDTFHHVDLGFKSEASAEQWAAGDALFRKKWAQS